MLDAVGRYLSAPVPHLNIWTPFPNSLATFLEGLLMLAVGVAADAPSARQRRVLGAGAALIGLACLLTMSRGAWLAIGAAAGASILVSVATRRVRPFLAAAAIVVPLAIGLAMTWRTGLDLVAAATTLGGTAVLRPDRFDIYEKSIALLNDVGVGGMGPGEQYAFPFSKVALVIQSAFVTYPHQLSLHLWLAYGAAGVVAWTWWVSGLAAAVGSAERYEVSSAFRGAWCGLVAVLVHGLSDARQAADPWTWLPVFCLSALVAARHRRTGLALPRRWLLAPLACAALTLTLASARFWPLGSAWHTRHGILLEARGWAGAGPADNPSSAALEYQRALRIDPSHPGAHRRLALIAAGQGNFQAAFQHATAALAVDPHTFATRKIAGLTAAWAGHDEAAITLLEDIPGVAGELSVWAAAWQERGQTAASDASSRLALRLTAARRDDADWRR